jgi:alpha-beta hydrolase superfamily lysophospholipase
VDPDGSREFSGAMGADRCTIKIYPELYHEIFNELEPDRAGVLADLGEWITKQLDGRSR